MTPISTILLTFHAATLELKASLAVDACEWHVTDVTIVGEGKVIDGKATVTFV